MWPFLGSLVSAGSSLIGGLFGQSSAAKNNATQMQIAQQQMAAQREFAQNGVQWKVEDAKRAGIHPLYALGANTVSYSPVSVGTQADNSLGEGLKSAGQDLGRAISATADRELRALQLMGARLDVEKKGLENDVLRTSLASDMRKLSQPGNPPPIPFPVTDPRSPKVDQEKLQNQIRLFGKTLLNDPYTSDAQTAENVFGEGVSDWLWPFLKIPSTLWYNRGPRSKFNKGNSKYFRVGN